MHSKFQKSKNKKKENKKKQNDEKTLKMIDIKIKVMQNEYIMILNEQKMTYEWEMTKKQRITDDWRIMKNNEKIIENNEK